MSDLAAPASPPATALAVLFQEAERAEPAVREALRAAWERLQDEHPEWGKGAVLAVEKGFWPAPVWVSAWQAAPGKEMQQALVTAISLALTATDRGGKPGEVPDRKVANMVKQGATLPSKAGEFLAELFAAGRLPFLVTTEEAGAVHAPTKPWRPSESLLPTGGRAGAKRPGAAGGEEGSGGGGEGGGKRQKPDVAAALGSAAREGDGALGASDPAPPGVAGAGAGMPHHGAAGTGAGGPEVVVVDTEAAGREQVVSASPRPRGLFFANA